MYTPRSPYFPKRKIPEQRGGDYISTISSVTDIQNTTYTDPSTLSTTDITLSSLIYIMQVANITSLDALTTLTSNQISTLTGAIDMQISADQSQIASAQMSIAQYTSLINGPNGLQAQYDLANQQYLSSVSAYNATSTLLLQDQANYANDISTLSSLYTLSTMYVSSINIYQQQYNSLVQSLQANSTTFSYYETDYQASISNLNSNGVLWSTSLVNFSTISSIVAVDLGPPLNQQAYVNDLSTLNNISTNISNYANLDGVFKANIVSSYNNISSLLGPSSFVLFESNTLLSTISYYQGMDAATQSAINSIQTDITSIVNQISDLTASNIVVLSGIGAEIYNTTQAGNNFYTLYGQALDAECDEYLYGIQQLNSQIGYITASLGIARNANAVKIDNYTFTILQNPSDNVTPGLKSALIADNDIIYRIIQQINSLDAQFSQIISYIGLEKTARETFIGQRQNIFLNYEVLALGMNTSQISAVQSAYFSDFSDLNATIDSINNYVSQRTTILGGIQNTFNNPLNGTTGQPVRALINQYFSLYLNTTDDQLPDNILYLYDDSGNPLGGSVIAKEYNPPSTVLPTNGTYAFIPPIVF